jgi:hypothetical protein
MKDFWDTLNIKKNLCGPSTQRRELEIEVQAQFWHCRFAS